MSRSSEANASGATELAFPPAQPDRADARIRVIGVGGGGGNAMQRMASGMAEHVDVVCVNTDAQALRSLEVGHPLQIGRETTKGLGAGADPEVGRQAAQESEAALRELAAGADMLFIAAGMGGGTGTGAAPALAELAREAGVLTVAVVTRPFAFEGARRAELADQGIRELARQVDSIITIPNDRLLSELDRDLALEQAFAEADRVLHDAVCGISDLILRPGAINVDFADVRSVMRQQGLAMMGTGVAEGERRAVEATQQAINCRLLDEVEITDASAMLINVTTARGSLGIAEFQQIGEELEALMAGGAQVVMGTTHDERMGARLKLTLVVAGFGAEEREDAEAAAVAAPEREPRPGRRVANSDVRGGAAPPPTAPAGHHAQAETRGPADIPAWAHDRGKFDAADYLRRQRN